jgi:NADH:ubiquinone oxidoreductase subunit E
LTTTCAGKPVFHFGFLCKSLDLFAGQPEKRQSDPTRHGIKEKLAMELEKVDAILKGKGARPFDVIEALQDIQEEFRYLPEEAMCRVSETLNIPLIEVFRLANFYKTFSLKPRGRHLITVCEGTACHVQGAPRLVEEVVGQLKIQPGETTRDGAFTVETVNCVGACALAPVLIIDGSYYDHMTPGKLRGVLESVRQQDQEDVTSA